MRHTNLYEFIRQMPKVNLHVHVEGSISATTLLEIAQQNRYLEQLSAETRQELQGGSFKFKDFPHFIATYSLCSNALRTAADYERVTYEYLRLAHENNIRYAEIYISPYNRMQLGLSFEEIVTGAARGRERALAHWGIRADFIIDVGRHLLWTTAKDPLRARTEAIDLVRLASAAKPYGVIGFSLGGRESGYPVFPFVEAFELARQHGLHTKAHSGEESDADDIWYVIALLKAERLGNAVHAADDAMLMKYLAAHGIGIELCLTGNVLSGALPTLEQHPVKEYLKQGLHVAIADDDPALFNTDLTQEYQQLVDVCDLNADELQQVVMNQITMMWVSDEEKVHFQASFEDEFRRLRTRLAL
jgi:adenosine deaminase